VAIGDEANKVPGAHAALLDVVKSVSNTFDEEAYARLLAREDVRADFMVVSRSSLVRLPSLLAAPSFCANYEAGVAQAFGGRSWPLHFVARAGKPSLRREGGLVSADGPRIADKLCDDQNR
jgi:hypothetical protein